MVNIVFAPCKLQVETTGHYGIEVFRLAGSEGGVVGAAHCQGHVLHFIARTDALFHVTQYRQHCYHDAVGIVTS